MEIEVKIERKAFKKPHYEHLLNIHRSWLLLMLFDLEGYVKLRPIYRYKGMSWGVNIIHGRTIYYKGIFEVCINIEHAYNSKDKGFDTIAHEAAHVATRIIDGRMLHDARHKEFYEKFKGFYKHIEIMG